MDIFIAGVILIAAVAWDSSQAITGRGVIWRQAKPSAAIESSATAETPASECAQGHPLIIARDLTVQDSHETPAHGF